MKEIETGVEDLVDSLKAVNAESKAHKTRIRELEDAKSEMERQLEKIKKEQNTEELAAYREFKQKTLKS